MFSLPQWKCDESWTEKEEDWEREREKEWPVTIAVREVEWIPRVTSSAVEDDENPESPFLMNAHIFLFCIRLSTSISSVLLQKCSSSWYKLCVQ